MAWQILVSAGHYRETIVLKDEVVEILGDGNMQHILLESVTTPHTRKPQIETGSPKSKPETLPDRNRKR